ncbi:DUF4249 domain-containing protein [Sphingobacteriales bacterium UPWRP_1]|nr:hypothetical protein BVG80_09335 [Sphingobacteriales bacterium TSM_CSM]PSJ78555.1 DUF4249 domain-containing protein [Sphingobacteriales bacterium UPWRP_1]
MSHKKNNKLLLIPAVLAIAGALLMSACLQSITIDLPEYESQLVVESYLDANVPFYIVSVTESVSFFTPGTLPVSQSLPVVNNALVTITHGNITDTIPYVDSLRAYIKALQTPLTASNFEPYLLRVEDTASNRIATATTRFLPPIPIDTVLYLLNDSLQAAMLLYFYDPKPDTNYYKPWFANAANIFDRDSLHTWEFSDRALGTDRTSVGMNYNYRLNDTVVARLYHISREYFRFLDTVEDAADASGGPFSRPARIESNIQGGTGIFTALTYDQRMVIIKQ